MQKYILIFTFLFVEILLANPNSKCTYVFSKTKIQAPAHWDTLPIRFKNTLNRLVKTEREFFKTFNIENNFHVELKYLDELQLLTRELQRELNRIGIPSTLEYRNFTQEKITYSYSYLIFYPSLIQSENPSINKMKKLLLKAEVKQVKLDTMQHLHKSFKGYFKPSSQEMGFPIIEFREILYNTFNFVIRHESYHAFSTKNAKNDINSIFHLSFYLKKQSIKKSLVSDLQINNLSTEELYTYVNNPFWILKTLKLNNVNNKEFLLALKSINIYNQALLKISRGIKFLSKELMIELGYQKSKNFSNYFNNKVYQNQNYFEFSEYFITYFLKDSNSIKDRFLYVNEWIERNKLPLLSEAQKLGIDNVIKDVPLAFQKKYLDEFNYLNEMLESINHKIMSNLSALYVLASHYELEVVKFDKIITNIFIESLAHTPKSFLEEPLLEKNKVSLERAYVKSRDFSSHIRR